jgi:CRP-like cAMP-binding protein
MENIFDKLESGGGEMKELSEKLQMRLRGKYDRLRDVMSEENFDAGVFCELKKGEYLFREGDEADKLYLLLEGRCRVFKTVESGKMFLISHYKGLSVIGEVELFDHVNYQSDVQMLDNGLCFVLSIRDQRAAMLEDLRLMRFIAKQLCVKVERSDRNTSINLTYSLKERLSSYILYAQEDGCFSSNYTHLANHLGCSHRHLLRTLENFRNNGVLKKEGKGYRIINSQWLKDQAGDEFFVSREKI